MTGLEFFIEMLPSILWTGVRKFFLQRYWKYFSLEEGCGNQF